MWNKTRWNRAICLSLIVLFTGLALGCGEDPDPDSVSPLQGTWHFHMLSAGDDPQFTGWGHGTVSIDADETGTTASMTRSNGDSNPPPVSSFGLSASDVVTISGTDFNGSMNAQKDMIVGVVSDGGGGSNLLIYSKQSATTFAPSDLAGTWNFHALVSGDSPQFTGWVHGTVTNDASGTSTFTSLTRSDGNSSLPSGTSSFAMSPSGIVTIAGKDFHGVMNAQKDRIVGVMTDGGGGYNLLIYSKQSAATFSASDMAGTWKYKGLISGDAPDQKPGWYRGTWIFDGNGSFVSQSTITDSLGNTGFTPGAVVVDVSSSGVVTFPGSNFSGVMNEGKNMIVGVASMAPGRDTDVSGFNLVIILK